MPDRKEGKYCYSITGGCSSGHSELRRGQCMQDSMAVAEEETRERHYMGDSWMKPHNQGRSPLLSRQHCQWMPTQATHLILSNPLTETGKHLCPHFVQEHWHFWNNKAKKITKQPKSRHGRTGAGIAGGQRGEVISSAWFGQPHRSCSQPGLDFAAPPESLAHRANIS